MSDPDSIDGRARRYAHRRPELLAAVTEYTLEHGVNGLSLRPMAAALGVSHSALVRHFTTKEGLLLEVVAELRRLLLVQLNEDPALAAATDTRDLLRTFWDRLADAPRERRQFIVLVETYALYLREAERHADLLDATVSDFLSPIKERLAADGVPPERVASTATALLALLRGLQLDYAATGDLERTTEAFDGGLDALLR